MFEYFYGMASNCIRHSRYVLVETRNHPRVFLLLFKLLVRKIIEIYIRRKV